MTITESKSAAIPALADAFIERAYAALALQADFKSREGQRMLSRAICASLLTRIPLAAEAPTGTGKTLAYLIGALAAKAGDFGVTDPIVIATATKALQAQLMQSDLPKLVATGAIAALEFAIAKGKSNYICIRDAHDVQRLGQSILGDENDAEETPDESASIDPAQVALMSKAFDEGTWDGDFDSYMGAKPKALDRIKVKSETCTGKKCASHGSCAYYKARALMGGAKVIVSNHDLVLADLQMHADEAEPYFPAKQYMLVVDEAHKLPDKAISVGQKSVDIIDALNRVYKLRTVLNALERHPELAALVKKTGARRETFEAKPLVTAFQGLIAALDPIDVNEETSQLRFSKGVVPPALYAAADAVVREFAPVSLAISGLLTAMKEETPPENVAVRKSLAEASHVAVKAGGALKEAFQGIAAFTGSHRAVRWISKLEGRLSIHTSPLEGADVLKPLLWNSKRAMPVFVSATLRDLEGFGRFKRGCGMPANSQYEVLPYIFPYDESQIFVAAMNATPKMAERKAYMQELHAKLPKAIRPGEATLILVPSRVMLRELTPMLRSRVGEDAVLIQGDVSINALLEKHKKRVAMGLTSVLVGMATMAEGLDLPGKLCEHVIILALPFSVPTDPVEQELAEVLGSKYFGERSLPDAMTRLLQMVGRLLRRESDRGRITVFDRRLASTSYGRKMLAALPPFKKIIEPVTVSS